MTRVLLVDDHHLLRELLATVLQQNTRLKENFQAASLAEARQLLSGLDEKFDLAIVDVDLPNVGTGLGCAALQPVSRHYDRARGGGRGPRAGGDARGVRSAGGGAIERAGDGAARGDLPVRPLPG